MLSRLKGIETIGATTAEPSSICLWIWFPVWRELKPLLGADIDHIVILWIWFPVWRELKLMRWRHLFACPIAFTLDMVSRLKGIETVSCDTDGFFVSDNFGYGFPFEGNWNSRIMVMVTLVKRLWICFPVWRELKHLLRGFWRLRRGFPFGYAFPFEGNWNPQHLP